MVSAPTYLCNKRFIFLIVTISTIFATICCRLIYLHTIGHEKYGLVVEKSRNRFEIIPAKRGNIIDAKGTLLASTDTKWEIGLDPKVIKKKDLDKMHLVSHYLNLPFSQLEKALDKSSKRRWVKLHDSVPEEIYEKINTLNIHGLYGNKKHNRFYPQKSLASHIIGFINKDNTPVGGIEQAMEFYLKGQDGWSESEKDGKRRELAQFRERYITAKEGANVELTIDVAIQSIIESEIESIINTCSPKSVSIIVSEPKTGYILGLANYPTFDPNTFWKYDLDTQRNRAISDIYEPGSPFKIITASAAFNENLVSLEETFDCSLKTVLYKGKKLKLPKDHRPLKVLSFRDVIKKSSNRGTVHVALRLGEEKLFNYAKAFGFGEKTGYPQAGEAEGILLPVHKWDSLTITRFPFGHAIACTPLQMHYAMSIIANKGVLMHPQIVKRVFDDANQTLVDFPPLPKRRVIPEETANKVALLLSEVVSREGTSFKAAIPNLKVSGKSGTTQKIIDKKYSTTRHASSFSGFFPTEQPKVLVTIVIDDAQIGRVAYGSIVCAPSFKKIGEALVEYLNIPPSQGTGNLI